MLFRLNQRADRVSFSLIRFHVNKGNDYLSIPDTGGFVLVSIYLLVEPMGFDAGISG